MEDNILSPLERIVEDLEDIKSHRFQTLYNLLRRAATQKFLEFSISTYWRGGGEEYGECRLLEDLSSQDNLPSNFTYYMYQGLGVYTNLSPPILRVSYPNITRDGLKVIDGGRSCFLNHSYKHK